MKIHHISERHPRPLVGSRAGGGPRIRPAASPHPRRRECRAAAGAVPECDQRWPTRAEQRGFPRIHQRGQQPGHALRIDMTRNRLNSAVRMSIGKAFDYDPFDL